MNGNSPSESPSLRRVLWNRPFALLWLGQLVSNSGDYIFDVAIVWLVLKATGSPLYVGLVLAASLLPGVLVGPIAGVYVDKLNRRSLMLASNAFQAALSLGIALLYVAGLLPVWALLVLIFMLNAGAQFVRPTVTAVIPVLVERTDLPAANGLISMSSSLNQFAGYGLGGLAVLLFGPTLPIYYNAATFVFAFVMVSMIAPARLATPGQGTQPGDDSFLGRFKEGVHYIASSRLLLEILVLALVVNFFGSGVGALFGPYASLTIHGDAFTYGILLAASALGLLVGSLTVAKVNMRSHVGHVLFGGIVAIGIVTMVMGAFTFLTVAVAMSALLGFFEGLVNLPLQVLIQARVPGNLLGRVVTSLGAMVTAATPVSTAISGGVANSLSVAEVFVIYGGLIIVVTAISFLFFKDLRQTSY
ncbi:MAG: MFS transporter [Nitrososphaerales archaeon]